MVISMGRGWCDRGDTTLSENQNNKTEKNETFSFGGGTYQIQPIAQDNDEIRRRHADNRAAWNEGAVRYTQNIEQVTLSLKNGVSNLHPLERAHLGNLADWCNIAVHLQCASGHDTLSLWLEGAKNVIGIDISDVHIANAQQISSALNAPATWYCCDVLDTPHELNGIADLVYTGQGAICWIQDIENWAKVIQRLLKPGGKFHILDDHPFTWLFDTDAKVLKASNLNYFSHAESNKGWPTTYIGKLSIPFNNLTNKWERIWTLADIVNALIKSGLTIQYLGEHPDEYWTSFPNLKPELRGRIPLTFSILAIKPV
jgi:SAM-dependent methyltransferase